jgi:hypothetical protein
MPAILLRTARLELQKRRTETLPIRETRLQMTDTTIVRFSVELLMLNLHFHRRAHDSIDT